MPKKLPVSQIPFPDHVSLIFSSFSFSCKYAVIKVDVIATRVTVNRVMLENIARSVL